MVLRFWSRSVKSFLFLFPFNHAYITLKSLENLSSREILFSLSNGLEILKNNFIKMGLGPFNLALHKWALTEIKFGPNYKLYIYINIYTQNIGELGGTG